MKLKNIPDLLKNMFCKKNKDTESVNNLHARIIVSELNYNNSVMIADENGEAHTPPVPDPHEEEFLVKKGDQVNGFEVLALTANFLELKSFTEYTDGHASTPKTHFIVEKGECINLNMYGVRDAVHRISIKFIETI